MKVLLSCALASAIALSASPASAAFCLKKPSESELRGVTLDLLKKESRRAQGLYGEDITISNKKCDGLGEKNTWTATTPIGQFSCKATDKMERPSCRSASEDQESLKSARK